MDKQSVISFFDNRASRWDEISVQKDSVLNKILDYAGVKTGVKLLDVACGTGVLFDKYIERGVKNFTAIDISPEMVKKAQEKYNEIDIVCGDAEEYNFEKHFDCIIVFNAFPHFVNPQLLFKNLASRLNNGGRLTIAHGASREDIIKCHSGDADLVSNILPTAEELADLMKDYLTIDTVISDCEKYIVSGLKKYYR